MVEVAVRPRGPNGPFYGEAQKAAGAFYECGARPRGVVKVSSGETGQRFVALLDGQPRVGREYELRQLIQVLEWSDIWLAARASYPEGGPDDGLVECLLLFSGDEKYRVILRQISRWLWGASSGSEGDELWEGISW